MAASHWVLQGRPLQASSGNARMRQNARAHFYAKPPNFHSSKEAPFFEEESSLWLKIIQMALFQAFF